MPHRPLRPLSVALCALVALGIPEARAERATAARPDGRGPPLLVQTLGEIYRVDDQGRQPVLTLPRAGAVTAHLYQPMVVDEPTGRWFVTRRLASEGGRRPPFEILTSDAPGVAWPGDPRCGATMTCFEVPIGFTTDGAGIITMSTTRRGDTLARYELATRARRVVVSDLASKVLAEAQDRVAIVRRGGFRVTAVATPPAPPARALELVVGGRLVPLGLTDTTLYYHRTARGAAATLEAIDLATRQRRVLHPGDHYAPWGALTVPARGGVLVHTCAPSTPARTCDLVELTPTGARVAARGITKAFDVSADGRFVVARRRPPPGEARATAWDDVVVIDLATGHDVRVLREVDVETAQFTR